MATQGHLFLGNRKKPMREYILPYNNFGLICKNSEGKVTAGESTKNWCSTIPLSNDASSRKIREYLHNHYSILVPETRFIGLHFSLIICVYLYSNFHGGLRKNVF